MRCVGVLFGDYAADQTAPNAECRPFTILRPGRAGAASLVAAPKRHTYGEGGTIAFRVNFTEPVVATGIPTLPISIGDTVR